MVPDAGLYRPVGSRGFIVFDGAIVPQGHDISQAEAATAASYRNVTGPPTRPRLSGGMLKPAPVLEGRFVRLEPLSEGHREPLRAACDADPDVWTELYPVPMNGENLDVWWRRIERDQAAGAVQAYAGISALGVVGCSVFMLDPPNRRVEIGNTYWRPDARGGAVNPESKMLMLAHAFRPGGLYETGAAVVQFRVDAINTRSRAAVLKLGAHLDGILRHDRIVWTGRLRDTCVFSILSEEWAMVRDKLEARLMAVSAQRV